MKFLKQIEGRKFVVELEDCDFENENLIYISHEFFHLKGISHFKCNETDLEGEEFKHSCGSIKVKSNIAIDVRTMIELVLPYLNNHHYMQPEHIQGTYNYMGNPITLCGCEPEEDLGGDKYVSTKRRYEKVREGYKPTGEWLVTETRHTYNCMNDKDDKDDVREYNVKQKYLEENK